MLLSDCGAFVGIDWADQEHLVYLIDPKAPASEKPFKLGQDSQAISKWVTSLQKRFPGEKIAVCLEQKKGALIYALMKFECLILVPVNPKQLARFREAVGSSGAKDDPTDARLLAELLMKHHEHLRAWQPDDCDTRKIRLMTEDRRKLVDRRSALTNRIKSRLKEHFPLALQVCGSEIHGNLACQFLLRYSRLENLQADTDEQLTNFYREHHCFRKELIEKRLEKIRAATPLTTDPAILEAGAMVIEAAVKQVLVINEAVEKYDQAIAAMMAKHPDAEIFNSLPGAGDAMAPRLLAAMGSDRDRLADAAEVQQLSGIAPVTRQSGNSKVVLQRWACSRFLRQTFHEFAAHSIKQSKWAKAYYDMMKDRGKKHQAAIRALAFKWIRIIFRCWKDRILYDEMTYCAQLIKQQSPLLKYLASNEK